MNVADLHTEALALVRKGLLLVREGQGDPVAFWHGFKERGACISLVRNNVWMDVTPDQEESGVIKVLSGKPSTGTPLYGVPYQSLPPPEALFRFGSEAVERYLCANGWDREEPLNPNFPDQAAHVYERMWQANCPLYSKDIAAVCGGWHFPWPDGDFLSLCSSELVVWTLAESEPWVEVFDRKGRLDVLQRVT